MNINEKIDSFKECACKLCDDSRDFKDYNAAANRYYYYIFRKINFYCKVIKNADPEYDPVTANVVGSHNKTIALISEFAKDKLDEIQGTDNIKELYLSQLVGSVLMLKDRRRKADYGDEGITVKQIKEIERGVNKIEMALSYL